jgi:hypothetical protein
MRVRPAGLFLFPGALAGAAPRSLVAAIGEVLTEVVVGGGERQPVSYPLESVRRHAAVPAPPMAFEC